MEIKKNLLETILNESESDTLEFKSAKNSFPIDALKTYSAFANTSGGRIVLGVEERENNKLYPVGIKNINKVKDEALGVLNNPQKVSRNILCEDDFIVIEDNDTKILIIEVPQALHTQKPIYLNNNPNNSYKRNGTGDYQCNKEEVRAMLRDSSFAPQDATIIYDFTIEEAFDLETIRRYRQIFANLKPEHPFNQFDDNSFLIKINAGINKDNKFYPTMAGLLMFGKFAQIRRILPHFHLEYIDKTNIDEIARWKTRILYDGSWGEGNLFNFFHQIINELLSTVPKSFLSKDSVTREENTDIQIALREALINALVHADYREDEKLLIIKNGFDYQFKNPGSLRITEKEFFTGSISKPRNPYIATMFRHINLAEEAGSGIPRILKAVSDNKLQIPRVKTDINKVAIILYTATIIEKIIEEKVLTEDEVRVLRLAEAKEFFSRLDLEEELSCTKREALKLINIMIEKEILGVTGKSSATKYYLVTDR